MSDQEGYKIVRKMGVEEDNTLTRDYLELLEIGTDERPMHELVLKYKGLGIVSLGTGTCLNARRDLVTEVILSIYRKGKQRVFDAIREPDFWDSWDLKYLESIKRNIEINIELIQSLKKAVTSGGEQK